MALASGRPILTVADVGQIDVILRDQEEDIAKQALTWEFVWRIVDGLFEALEGRDGEEESEGDEEEDQGEQEDQEGVQEDGELGADESEFESEEEAEDAEG
ncbi:hypothetical protein LTR78_008588 [Recurvomyces mirabilis]|uniref:Uncharacterized protein n=1 Tax=Recurvomyces mirabilis TaxID=574656 RepID=A0AAE0WIX2_9PEZI|nr:hypothetical protein LTR78_008588 [Recurvomyces mirabilis]